LYDVFGRQVLSPEFFKLILIISGVNDMNGKKRIAAFLLAAVVAVSILFSFNYISAHAQHQHHHPEEDCPICAVMEIAFRVVSQVKSVILPVLFIFVSVLSIRSSVVYAVRTERIPTTLVSQKVELLN